MKNCIIVDMDGTLSDPKDRLHYVKNNPKNFEAFEAECHKDDVCEPVAAVVNCMYQAGYKVLIVSARMDGRKQMTLDWLAKHKIQYDGIYMRTQGDTRKDDIVKYELLDKIKKDGYTVLFAVDDRKRVKRMWVENGIFVFDVNQKDKEY